MVNSSRIFNEIFRYNKCDYSISLYKSFIMAKTTLLIVLVGLLGFISIQAGFEEDRDLDPVYYNSFNEDILYEVNKGIKKYKTVFEDMELDDDKFYLVFSQCDGEKMVMITYMNCTNDDCALKRMLAASNRYMKINDTTVLPVVLASDLAHSNYFASTDGIRIRPPMEGYAITINEDNEVVSATFSDF